MSESEARAAVESACQRDYLQQFYADDRKPLKIMERSIRIHQWAGRDWMSEFQRQRAAFARMERQLQEDFMPRIIVRHE